MSFQKKSISFGIVDVNPKFEEDFDEAIFNASYSHVVPTKENDQAVLDFTSGVSLIDRDKESLELEDFKKGGLTYAAARKKERKIDRTMLQELLEKLIDEETKTTGCEVGRKRKKQLKEIAMDIASAPDNARIVSTGRRFVVLPGRDRMIVETTNYNKLIDAADVISRISQPLGNSIIPWNAEYLKTKYALGGSNWTSLRLSKKSDVEEEDIGKDFLTWLWIISDVKSVLANSPLPIEVQVTGDISLSNSATNVGARTIKLSKGTPALAKEGILGIVEGKKVQQASLSIAVDGRTFTATIDSDLVIKGYKTLEKSENLDSSSAFEWKFMMCADFIEGIEKLFKLFLERSSNGEIQNEVNTWLTEHIASKKTS